MEKKDIAIPIVFPDYAIKVDTKPMIVEVPDLLPVVNVLPARFKIPATKTKVPYLGHAGILFIDGGTGLTRYFEYGRYDPAEKGLARHVPIQNVRIGPNGRPTLAALKAVMGQLSAKSGQHGPVAGAYIELPAGAFSKMEAVAQSRVRDNGNAARAPYDLLDNSCLHFMKQVVEASGATMPVVLAPHPAGYVVMVRLQYPKLDWSRAGVLIVDGVELP